MADLVAIPTACHFQLPWWIGTQRAKLKVDQTDHLLSTVVLRPTTQVSHIVHQNYLCTYLFI